MSGQRLYGGAIWTNHALERLGQRGLSQDIASQAFNHPDASIPGKQSGTTEYTKRFGKSMVTIIATRNDKREWLILSCWIDPPLPGSIDEGKKEKWLDYRSAYSKAGFWGKLWLVLLKQLGLK
ncbi:MAG: hypothetical protein RI947_545 [Candidatus Parcubacteria bacterium]|jgi:hypothetical protein